MTRLSNRSRAWLGVAGVAAFLGLVVAFPSLLEGLTNHRASRANAIPPAFYGNRAAYAFSLFSLFSISSLAIRKLILVVAQLRSEPWREDPDVGLYRLAIILLLSVIILVAGPDVFVMLLYGEASDRTLAVARTVAYLGDGMALPVFSAAFLILVRVEQLERMPGRALADFLDAYGSRSRQTFYLVMPRREGIADHLRIVAFVFLIALGLALYK